MAGGPGTVTGYSILADRSYALSVPGYVQQAVLTANTAATITCPTDATLVLFSATADFAVSYNRSGDSYVADMSGTVTDGTGSELKPTARYIGRVGQAGSIINLSVVSPTDGCVVTASFYRT